MTTHVQRASTALQDALFDSAYYVDLYLRALGRASMSVASIDQYEFSNPRLVAMWKDFRESLPDSEEIRRTPFKLLSELLERHSHG